MEKNLNSFADNANTTKGGAIATTSQLCDVNLANGRVKLREKPTTTSTKYVKTSLRGARSRPFSCDIENLTRTNGLSNSKSQSNVTANGVPPPSYNNIVTTAPLGDRRLNYSHQALNSNPNATHLGHSDYLLNRNNSLSQRNGAQPELYDKSQGPVRLYERRNVGGNTNYSTQSHWYQGPLARKMHNYGNTPASVATGGASSPVKQPQMFRSCSQSELQQVSPYAVNQCIGLANDHQNEVVCYNSSNAGNSVNNKTKLYPNGLGQSMDKSLLNGLLPRREYGSTSSIDQLLTKRDQACQKQQQSSSANHSNSTSTTPSGAGGSSSHLTKLAAAVSSSTYASSQSSPSVPKQISTGSEHSRASLRREKAVDLPSYSSSEPSICAVVTTQAAPIASVVKESKSAKKDKAKTSRTKSGNESILRKLIGVSHKAHSTEVPDAMSTPVGCRDFIKPDFSSESLDFKYEEKIRRKIFAHYDCISVSSDVSSLLNGTSRLKEGSLSINSATGASQASRPKNTVQFGTSDGTVTSPVTEDNRGDDNGDGKSNHMVLSCPFFRNELGGEPVKSVALNRDNSTHLSTTTVSEDLETWYRPSTAAEASVLENLSNVYLGGRLCAKRQDDLVIEHVDQGAFFYRHCFSGKVHQNYFGIDDNLGPVAISVIRDKIEVNDFRKCGLTSPNLYRIIVRLSDVKSVAHHFVHVTLTTFRGTVLEDSLPSHQQLCKDQQQSGSLQSPVAGNGSSGKYPLRELLELVVPDLQLSCLRLALPVPRTEEVLLKLDEQGIYTRFKVGVLYCRSNQCTEEQMYNNEVAGQAFEEFLDVLGQRVRLKGFDKYKGGLDNKGDTTGQYSVYTTYQQYEIMFHVSTMLPFTPSNKQQLSRKRHIGNDIVTVVFQEPDALPFSAQTVRSHFQHVFIVVQAHNPNTDNVRYSVAVSRCKDVPAFGPALPPSATFAKSKDFRDFLLTKIINAENAVHKSDKFATMAARTRREFMRDLAENHSTSHSPEGSSGKIGKILGSSSNKRKDRMKPKLFLDSFVRGAIVWDVQVLTMVEDFALCKSVECQLGISADYLALIDHSQNQEVLFCTPTHSVIGWTSHGNSLKLYYDHAEVVILRTMDDDDSSEMHEILKRLQFVTKGCEAIEMVLRRNASGQLGFNIQQEGIVSDVEMYNSAWQAGLRQGSRLVEICKVSVATLTYDRMLEMLRTSINIRVMVIPPLEDGSPRRGCEDPYCPSVFTDESAFINVLPDNATAGPRHLPGRLPPSYETAMLRKLMINPNVPYIMELLSPESRTDNGYESGSNVLSKSLEDIQGKGQERRHSDALQVEHAYYDNGQNEYQSNTISSLSSEEQWQWSTGSTVAQQRQSKRTDTLSSSGSTASSEMSSSSASTKDGKHKLSRPSELKRKVDKSNSDSIHRILDQSNSVSQGVGPPLLPPKTYKPKVAVTQVSLSSGQLTVPPQTVQVRRQPINGNSNSVQESLLRLINDFDSDTEQGSSNASEGSQLPSMQNSLVPTNLQSSSSNASPEMNNYQLKFQAAQQRIRFLEEKVERLQKELENEQSCKHKLEYEMISLRDSNKRLFDECHQAQLELKKFSDWFFQTVENGPAE